MTRFEREWNGELGEFWKKHAHEEAQRLLDQADNIEVEDDVTTYMEFPNGATGVFVTTTADTPGTNRFEITGSKGTLVFQSNTLTFTKLEEDEREFCFKPDVGFSVPKSATSKINIYKPMYEQHVAILNNVANTILGIEDLYAPAEDGICGVELANAMHMSSWENATIELPTDSEKFYEKLMVKVENAKNRVK